MKTLLALTIVALYVIPAQANTMFSYAGSIQAA